jgi:Domain of unknown function (DUF5060)
MRERGCFTCIDSMSDGSPELITIDEQSDDQSRNRQYDYERGITYYRQNYWNVLSVITFVIGMATAAHAVDVGKWNRFEATITASKSYSDPYLASKVSLDVTYNRPGGGTVGFFGFYTGSGNTWKIRFMPDFSTGHIYKSF